MNKRNMNWNQAKKRYPQMNPNSDADFDGLVNSRDCKPFDTARDGFFARVLGKVTGDRFGQSAEDYAEEKELKRDVAEDIEERTVTTQAEKPIRQEVARQIETRGELTPEELESIRLKMEQAERFQRSKTGNIIRGFKKIISTAGAIGSFAERKLVAAEGKRKPLTRAEINRLLRAQKKKTTRRKAPAKRKRPKKRSSPAMKAKMARLRSMKKNAQPQQKVAPIYRAPVMRMPTSISELNKMRGISHLLTPQERYEIEQKSNFARPGAARMIVKRKVEAQQKVMKQQRKIQGRFKAPEQHLETDIFSGKPKLVQKRNTREAWTL